MLALELGLPVGRPLSVLAIGAHCDDIEIGAGGMLLSLARSGAQVDCRSVILTGTPERHQEARDAAVAFLPPQHSIHLHDLPEGRLPAAWAQVKEILESEARSSAPDVILAPFKGDAHQDHRTIGEIVPTVFRDQLCLGYEIPKWDGDLGRPATYYPLSAEVAQRKVELLNKCFPSQLRRDWWEDEVFLGLARLRGVECRSPYAEAFHCSKLLIGAPAASAESEEGN